MKNKNVGYLIIGIAIVIGFIILIFNAGLKRIVGETCSHQGCSMFDTIAVQTWLSTAIAGVILVIGLFLIYSKEETKIITKTKKVEVPIEKKSEPIDYSKLDKDEKIIIKSVEEANGTIFQSDLVEKTEFNKVKISRILDRLEGRQLIERKRRGMTNVVVLKN
jgi:uncharacterized membrane protein